MPFSEISDEELVARMAAGDQDALAALYDRYRRVTFSLALRILQDRAEAEEALADTFMQAWRQALGFNRTRGAVGAWLITLCRSRAIDRLRARGRRGAALQAMTRSGGDPEGTPQGPLAAGPDEAADLVLRRQRIRSALGVLSAAQRRAIEMAYYDGLSHSEIAAALGEPLGTVKTRIREGLLNLREKLGARFPT